jgi:hypothetical protein
MSLRTRALPALAAVLIALAIAPAAASADTQANEPQVAGDPLSDATAVFPTNKQNEPTIALDPASRGQVLLAGSNDEQEQPPCGPGPVRGSTALASDCSFFPGVGTNGVYRSTDGGATWTNLGMIDDRAGWQSSPWVSDGDPVIVFGPRAGGGTRAYYVSLGSYKPGQSPFPPNKAPEAILVSHSDDQGATWSAPVVASTKANPNTFNDKNSAWVDDNPSSPGYGNLYVAFTMFRSAEFGGTPGAPVGFARSTDGGQTFGATQQLSPAPNNNGIGGRQGTDIATGPDGTVYVLFEQYTSQVVAISQNLGGTFAKLVTVGPVADIDDPIPGANFRTDSFGSISVNQLTGRVWASWVNKTADGGRVVATSSPAGGTGWSSLHTVSGSEGYAFFNGMDVAPDGRVDIGYQVQNAIDPTTYGTGNASIDAYYAEHPAGGSWSTPVKVNDVSSDPAASAQNNLQRQFWGDYNTLVSSADHAWFISTDSRNGAGCPAVDVYQHTFSDQGIPTREDDQSAPKGNGSSTAGGKTPPPQPGPKPAPGTSCPAQFGNSDVYVATITP